MIVPHLASPLDFAESLSGRFPTVRACNELIRRGLQIEGAESLARTTLGRKANWPHAQFTEDEEDFVRLVRETKVESISENRTLPATYSGKSFARGRGKLPVGSVDEAVMKLSDGLNSNDPIDFLYEWPGNTRDYRSALLASACRSCLTQAPLEEEIATSICDEILGLANETETSLAVNTLATFDASRKAILGEKVALPDEREGSTFWERSLNCASALLAIDESLVNDHLCSEVISMVISRNAFIFDSNTIISENGITYGSGNPGTIWFPPAVRLASLYVSQRASLDDILGSVISERKIVVEAISTGPIKNSHEQRIYGDQNDKRAENTTKALRLASELVASYPRVVEAYIEYSFLLLIAGNPREAIQVALKGQNLCCFDKTRDGILLYNEACAFGQMGDESAVRERLEMVSAINRTLIQKARSDEDFREFFALDWFQDLSKSRHSRSRQ